MQARMLAWGAWLLLLVGVVADAALGPERTVVPQYRNAAIAWSAGEPLYQTDGMGFLYLPQASVLFAPLAWVSLDVAEMGWRAGSVALLAWAVSRFCSWAQRSSRESLFPYTTLFVIPLAVAGARNGQCTLVMTAMMLLGVVDLDARRWWRATCWLSLSVAAKPLAIVLVLLAFALYRPLRWRLILAAVVVALVPFLTQRPDYVMEQYAACRQNLVTAADHGQEPIWAQPFTVLRLCGIDVSSEAATAVRIGAAAMVLGLAWLARRRCDARTAATDLFALSAVYVLLFNPRSENNTYVLLAPVLGVCYAQARHVGNKWTSVFLALLAIGILGTFEFGRLVTPPEQSVWLAPVMTACFFVYLTVRIASRGWCIRVPQRSPLGQLDPNALAG